MHQVPSADRYRATAELQQISVERAHWTTSATVIIQERSLQITGTLVIQGPICCSITNAARQGYSLGRLCQGNATQSNEENLIEEVYNLEAGFPLPDITIVLRTSSGYINPRVDTAVHKPKFPEGQWCDTDRYKPFSAPPASWTTEATKTVAHRGTNSGGLEHIAVLGPDLGCLEYLPSSPSSSPTFSRARARPISCAPMDSV
ncbi:hypothetical protein HPB51_010305 [Rhipicephalus microplus]|uniref:Uncharacterized protein n=1 Tax=Rhipicephalus microplus TaxID=6941 RepID=A0A9J6DZS2_RHIMP|nr:hypothetical protein HPB51_010305 [Rhipicephalus microplus]